MGAAEAEEWLRQVKLLVTVKDRKYHFKSYKNCFLGRDLVAAIKETLGVDEKEALRIGLSWQIHYKWFSHVSSEHKLENRFLFYSWTENRQVSRRSGLLSPIEPCQEKEDDQEGIIIETDDFSVLLAKIELNTTMAYISTSPFAITIKDRSYRAKTYKECFLGNELVDWIESTLLLDRYQSTSVGELLFSAGYFRHVVDDKMFFDNTFFYSTRKARLSVIPLSEKLEDIKSDVFEIVELCLEKLKPHTDMEGLFRISFASVDLERLQVVLNCFKDTQYIIESLRSRDLPILYASLIKQQLARLENGLLPISWCSLWTQEEIVEKKEDVIGKLMEVLALEPPENISLSC